MTDKLFTEMLEEIDKMTLEEYEKLNREAKAIEFNSSVFLKTNIRNLPKEKIKFYFNPAIDEEIMNATEVVEIGIKVDNLQFYYSFINYSKYRNLQKRLKKLKIRNKFLQEQKNFLSKELENLHFKDN